MRVARRVLAIAAFAALLVGGWVFAARHPQGVSIDYYFGQTRELPLWIALLAAAALGAALLPALRAVRVEPSRALRSE